MEYILVGIECLKVPFQYSAWHYPADCKYKLPQSQENYSKRQVIFKNSKVGGIRSLKCAYKI